MNVNQVNVPLQPTKEAALEAIMHEYGEKIIQLAYLIVKDRSMAEDITQEVFIKAYQSLDSFRGDSSLRTWLYRIAINESRKYLRSWSFRNIFSTFKQKKEKRMETIDPADVESTVLASVRRAEIAEMVMSMSPQYREIITLHYYEDLSIREVSHVLGVSEDAVRTKLSRARRQFKKLMEKEGTTWI
ncbi:sigma-70 family RNA polymerase sigma factor [Brevibacillus marinus]|uniref:sigma-70 family RNA polymerase sigma factor n=1 Tax=Brevibacillus marinus TaxID=2496837 RepID=UPI001F49C667|nr:sigma-70 family RNA polymerase sigma factor [Brevibacillus marinus]